MSDENDDLDLSGTIAAALESQQDEGIIAELVSQSDDTPDTSETPEDDKIEGESSDDDGESTEQAEEPDSPSEPVASETDTEPERDPKLADVHRQFAEAFGSVIAPYQAHIASKGIAAPQAVQALLAAEYQLSTGTPEQKARIMARLAKDYDVDLDAMYGLEDREPVAPEIAQLQQRQAGLERIVAVERQQAEVQIQQEVQGAVVAFADEKDAAGNLLHPHLEKVRSAMGRAIDENNELNLEQAYEKAVKAEPSLRKQVPAKRGVAKKPGKTKPRAKPTKEPSLHDDLTREYKRIIERDAA